MDEKHARLFERIRDKCKQRQWYGPDEDNPMAILKQVQSVDEFYVHAWYDQNDQQHLIDKNTDIHNLPIPQNFLFAPATETQLQVAEQTLGFVLPALLRELYANVANGGFGPAYGINGVNGGFGSAIDIDYLYTKGVSRLVDISFYEKRQQPTKLLQLPEYVHPDRFITLCHWGCAMYSYLDCASGRVFGGSGYRDFYGFSYQAPSLFEWLDRWVNGQLRWIGEA